MIISILYYSKKKVIKPNKTLTIIPSNITCALDKIAHNIQTKCTPNTNNTPLTVLKNKNRTISLIDTTYNDSTQDESYISIVKTNVKSAYTLSTDIKKALSNMDTLNNDIISSTSHIKDHLFNTSDYINTLQRNTFNITALHNNIKSDLEDTYETTQLLKNILIELDNLSTMTTHLANKATLEKTHTPPSPEVMNFIIKEFHSYSDEIRHSILKMNTIFSTLDKKYFSCNKEFKNCADLMATYSLTLTKITHSLDNINSEFNNILKSDISLKAHIESSKINAKRLIADTSELRTNITYLIGNTYATKKSINISK